MKKVLLLALVLVMLPFGFDGKHEAQAARSCIGQWPGSTMEVKVYDSTTGTLLETYNVSDPGETGLSSLNRTLNVSYGHNLMFQGVATAPDNNAPSEVWYPYASVPATTLEGSFQFVRVWQSTRPMDSDSFFSWTIDPTCNGTPDPDWDGGHGEIYLNLIVESTPTPTGTVCVQSNVTTHVNTSRTGGSGYSDDVTGGATATCHVGAALDTYTATGSSLAGYTGPTYDPGGQTQSLTTDGQTITFNLTYTSTGGGAPPTGAVTCSPATQTVQTGTVAGFSATGGDGNFSWSAPSGSPNSGSGANFSTTYSNGQNKTVTVTSNGQSATCSVSLSSNPPPPPTVTSSLPTCTGGAPQSAITAATSGDFYIYAYGVQNATSVVFPTWSGVNGQDDINWYSGTNLGGGTWRATVNLANHRAGNPDYGQFTSAIYMSNDAYTNTFCANASFTRDRAPIGSLDLLTCPHIGGWAFDQDTSSDPISVHMYKDGPAGSGTFVDAVDTTGYRPDVNAVFGITGNHGFNWVPAPVSIGGGAHSMYFYGINTLPGGNNSLIGQGTLTNPANYGNACTGTPSAPNACGQTGPGGAGTIQCDGSCSGATGSPPPNTCASTVTLSASPNPVTYGMASTLTWDSTKTVANSCAITGGSVVGGSTNLPVSGSKATTNLTANTVYTATCTGLNGSPVSDSVTVNVGGPSVDIKADGSNGPITVEWNANPTLAWTVANASSCVASAVPASGYGNWSGSKDASTGTHSQSTSNLTVPQKNTYTITCTGNGSASDSVEVTVNPPKPTVGPGDPTYTAPDYCSSGPGGYVTWSYSDPSGSTQTAYEVQITNTGNFNNPFYDSGQLNSSSHVFSIPNGVLQFNLGYKARVRVWNTYNSASDWSNPTNTFNTPNYAYPDVEPPYQFTWSPTRPQQNKPVQFTDHTAFGGGNSNSREWNWNFGDGGTSTQQNPAHTYTVAGSYTITEIATDAANQSCGYSQSLNIQKPIPVIKEVAPK